jgi:phosphate transport system substrate-binding protein
MGHVENMSKLFEKGRADCNFAVLPSDTPQGFDDLSQGRIDMTIATREATDNEKQLLSKNGKNVKSRLIGSVSLAIVINKANPVNSLTIDQIKSVFSGVINDWKDLGGQAGKIRVLTQPVPETGAGVAFAKQVLDGGKYASDHQDVRSLSSLARICGKDVNAIGYIPTSTVFFKDSAKKGMKIVALREKKEGPPLFPKYGATKKAFYPIQMPFYLYWDSGAKSKKCLENFAKYIDKQTM